MTSPYNAENPSSITAFRGEIRNLLAQQSSAGRQHDIVILAIDGVPYDLAAASWPNARITRSRSVFPSTSSTAWLSSLTGQTVGGHGIPGVVFDVGSAGLINIFEYRGQLDCPDTGNIFSDASDFGYLPISIMGDWEPYDCSWRDILLRHSVVTSGARFFTSPSPWSPGSTCASLLSAIMARLDRRELSAPKLVWCFVDADRHIHHHGYDEDLLRFLEMIEDIALELARRDTIVVAHSDHGLVRTSNNAKLAQLVETLQDEYRFGIGGAGRVRWIYPKEHTRRELVSRLEQSLSPAVRLCAADEVFGQRSLARDRVGEIVLIAEDVEFLTFSGHRFDHGSSTEGELNVPLAIWNA
jgi:hypothetical protein